MALQDVQSDLNVGTYRSERGCVSDYLLLSLQPFEMGDFVKSESIEYDDCVGDGTKTPTGDDTINQN